jgi:hypothetical protein
MDELYQPLLVRKRGFLPDTEGAGEFIGAPQQWLTWPLARTDIANGPMDIQMCRKAPLAGWRGWIRPDAAPHRRNDRTASRLRPAREEGRSLWRFRPVAAMATQRNACQGGGRECTRGRITPSASCGLPWWWMRRHVR